MSRLLLILLFTNQLSADLLSDSTVLIQHHESFRSKPYLDSTGNLTIGYGTNLAIGISQEEAIILLQFRLTKLHRKLSKLSWYNHLSSVRKLVILDMAYNIGYYGLLTFKSTIWCLSNGYYHAAANHMRDSLWYYQTGTRAQLLVHMMYTNSLKEQ